MKIAIADDENSVCARIEECIVDYMRESGQRIDVSVYYSGEEICSALKAEAFDMIFLDIELGQCSGIDVAEFIRDTQNDQTTQIVFVTGKTGYDRLLFEYRPFGFIAKPVSEQSIADILRKYRKIYGDRTTTFGYISNHTECWVRLSDVIYFESEDRRVNMYVKGSDAPITFYMKMTDIYDRVKNDRFLFIHKSYIVNEEYVSILRPDLVRMTNGKELPVSRLRRKKIMLRQMRAETEEYPNDDR